jgi:hypothetical protein
MEHGGFRGGYGHLPHGYIQGLALSLSEHTVQGQGFGAG